MAAKYCTRYSLTKSDRDCTGSVRHARVFSPYILVRKASEFDPPSNENEEKSEGKGTGNSFCRVSRTEAVPKGRQTN